MRWHRWHDWSEWSDVETSVTVTDAKSKRERVSTAVGSQERRCGKCGLLERQKVYEYSSGWQSYGY